MQEIDLNAKVLLEFSHDYCRVPNINIEGGEGIPFDCLVLAAWFSDMHYKNKHSIFFSAFQAYLCGRGEFVLPELTNDEFMTLLAEALTSKIKLSN